MNEPQVIDRYSRIRNTQLNLDFLDSPKNADFKNFFYINLSADEQTNLLYLPEYEFRMKLEKRMSNSIRTEKIKQINRNVISRIYHKFIDFFNYNV